MSMMQRLSKPIMKNMVLPEEPPLPFTKPPAGICAVYDLPYIEDGDAAHTLDLFYPEKGKQLPVLLDIHGGGFMAGDKSANRAYACAMAKHGFLVCTINYRLVDKKITVPDQVQDVAAAAAWLLEGLGDYPANLDRIYLSGDSAGAVLAVQEALIAASERLQAVYDIHTPHPAYRGIFCNCGYFSLDGDTVSCRGMRHSIFGRKHQKSPLYQNMRFSHLEEIKELPPVFLTSGVEDFVGWMTKDFQKLLQSAGVPNKLLWLTQGRRWKLGHCISVFHPEYPPCQMLLKSAAQWLKKLP